MHGSLIMEFQDWVQVKEKTLYKCLPENLKINVNSIANIFLLFFIFIVSVVASTNAFSDRKSRHEIRSGV